jgi:uncharacterized protein YciI
MLYVLTCLDAPNTAHLRTQHIDEHRERVAATKAAGNLLLAGPLFNDDHSNEHYGSLIIVDFPTLPEAQAWADAEPFLKYGIYESITLKQFKRVF